MIDMKVEKDYVVRLKMKMYTADNDYVEESGEDGVSVLIGHQDIFPQLELALLGKKVGDKIHVKLEPDEAFGESDDSLVDLVPASLLGDNIEPGMKIYGKPGVPGDDHYYTVLGEVESGDEQGQGDFYLIDGNHPLAGESVSVDMEILEIQKPTEAEIEEMEKVGSDLFEISEVSRSDLPH